MHNDGREPLNFSRIQHLSESQDRTPIPPSVPATVYHVTSDAFRSNLRQFVEEAVSPASGVFPRSPDTLIPALVLAEQHKTELLELLQGVKHDYRKKRAAIRKDEADLVFFLGRVVESEELQHQAVELRDEESQSFLKLIADVCDTIANSSSYSMLTKARRLYLRVSIITHGFDPQSFLEGITLSKPEPVSGGGFADVYRGQYRGRSVALKKLRVYQTSELNELQKKICQEASVWRHLKHDHILEFVGVDAVTFHDFGIVAMVSPWMSNGTIIGWVQKAGLAPEEVESLLQEVARGLSYLHSQEIVHGDLRGPNVLIDEDGRAHLCDFGLAKFVENTITHTASNMDGSPQWMAPELFNPEIEFQRTTSSDMYAFGCVCVETFTGLPPFGKNVKGMLQIEVMKGARPARPAAPGMIMSDNLWMITEECWAHFPAHRPTMQEVLRRFVEPPAKVYAEGKQEVVYHAGWQDPTRRTRRTLQFS